jgi:hypothetical protein
MAALKASWETALAVTLPYKSVNSDDEREIGSLLSALRCRSPNGHVPKVATQRLDEH